MPGARTIAVLVHGFGGSKDSASLLRTAAACQAAGLSCLRLSLRGADQAGDDIYHAGIVEDVLAAIASPEVAAYDNVVIIGHSLGGHLALHAAWVGAPKLRAVVAVSSPLDLSIGCANLDRLRSTAYREHILRTLKQIYRAFANRHPSLAPAQIEVVERLRTIRAWDEHVVIRRHGFASVDDYHLSQSMAPRLAGVDVPALYVGSVRDPMVPRHTVEPYLRDAPPNMDVHMLDEGGHVVFPRRICLGYDGPLGADAQILAWLRRHVR